MVPVAAVLLLALMGASAGTPAVAGYGAVYSGRATFYGGAPDGMNPYSPSYGTKEGSCGYYQMSRNEWPYWSVAGVATSGIGFRGPTEGCGSCWKISCSGSNPGGVCNSAGASVVVTITDKCPECGGRGVDFDMQALTFAKIANSRAGNIAIDYQQVPCNPDGGMFANVLDNRGAGGWARFGVENVAGIGQVASLSVNGVAAHNRWGAMFEMDSMPGSGPYDLTVMLADGKKVYCANAFSAGQTGRIAMNCQASSSGVATQSVGGVTRATSAAKRMISNKLAAYNRKVKAAKQRKARRVAAALKRRAAYAALVKRKAAIDRVVRKRKAAVVAAVFRRRAAYAAALKRKTVAAVLKRRAQYAAMVKRKKAAAAAAKGRKL